MQQQSFLRLAPICAIALAVAGATARAEPASIPSYISGAVADPARPADQVARDAARKPAEVIVFAGLKPGDRIGDFMSGNAYFTRIFSRVVGPSGHVYAFVPEEEIKNCSPDEVAGSRAIAKDPAYPNVSVSTGPVNSYAAPVPLDIVWTAQNYHDLHDPFMGPADLAKLDTAIFHALKPGGVFLVIDHAAQPGSGLRDTDTLHRIDPAAIIAEVEAAGFVLAGQSDALRNPADTHALRVFDPAIRGHTDQVVLKFVKPR
jgi:predicted methyltransferase